MSKKNIAVFGGSFNPVHFGHISLVNQLDEKLGFDKILIIPSAVPPHKPADDMILPGHRIKMCSLAAKLVGEKCSVDTIEILSGGVSYSVNTLRALKNRYPDDNLWFIMGSDMLLTLDKWYKYEEILSLASVAAAARNEQDKQLILKKSEDLSKRLPYCNIRAVRIEIKEISSTEIRRMIKNGKDVSGLVPDEIISYIKSNRLYV